jgi:translation initiation factor 2-alpha kinase 4
MGHSSRKKKKRGAAGRKAAKDHAAQHEGDQTALDEELTALTSILGEDFKVKSESPQTRLNICIRPYSDGMGFEDLNVSAILDVICFPGYPHKCPKLRVVPEKNLSKEDADRLLSLLVDQANIYSREGRVMIFDLFEAAQEFLSEITATHVSASTCLGSSSTTDVDVKVSLDGDPHPGISYIYTSFDLYSQLYDDTSWSRQGPDLTMDSSRKNSGSQVKSNVRSKRKTIIEKSYVSADKAYHAKSSSGDKAEQQRAAKHGVIQEAAPNLHVVAEETENDSKTLSTSNAGNTSDSPERCSSSLHEPEDADLADEAWNEEDCDSDFSSSNGSSYVSDMLDDASRNKQRDLIMYLN